MKKKILFTTEALWFGGIETALINLLNRMDYEKYDVTLLLQWNIFDGDMLQRVPKPCKLVIADRSDDAYHFLRLYHLTTESKNPSRLHRAMMWTVPAIKWVENRLYIRYIREQMRGEHFDTCIIYSDRTAEAAVRAIRADRYLMFYHHGAMRRAYHDEIGYRRSDKVITVSEKTLDMLKSFRPAHAEKIMVLHNIVDIESVLSKSLEFSADLPADTFNLVSCGRLTEAKGIDWAIRAMELLLEKGCTDVHWWIVGGGPDEQKLKALAEKAGVTSHFHFLGMQHNPYPYIAAADLYVQPSRFENYSVVILEAMALCKPILATTPAARYQIQSGENGLLCDPDPNSIAQSIDHLRLHREEMERYAQTLKEHRLEKENEAIMERFCQLLNSKSFS